MLGVDDLLALQQAGAGRPDGAGDRGLRPGDRGGHPPQRGADDRPVAARLAGTGAGGAGGGAAGRAGLRRARRREGAGPLRAAPTAC